MRCSIRLFAATLVLVVGLVACSESQSGSDSSAAEPKEAPLVEGLDGPVIRHTETFSRDAEHAEVVGVVEIENECLYIRHPDGNRSLAVWPWSTTWDPDSSQLNLPNGDPVAEGDSVAGGGGYRDLEWVHGLAGPAAADQANRCADDQNQQVAVINNMSDGIALLSPGG